MEHAQQMYPKAHIERRICAKSFEEERGAKKMDNMTADHSEPKAMPQAKVAREKKATVDQFAEARKAKKKAKRRRHRAKLKRSHTKG